eukprot:Gregarina_sp_Pseudo_9__3192@NODE_337_length_3116_cov_17_791355_g317_i0_p2_GENE_NODE_337_length_3116_cov_17_791355_g317_i0NODE_337_length_3116_cov_17_791355_g317_i0_p2_ORF_typecomplete_len275_score68_70DSPc/PF00782_20/3_8e13Y_phosphatase3/PF13350_6/0_00086CDKN3/PF05706_12/0_0065Y_phosphatase2/PF03162_13/0_024Y_phosphatase/PF00102_27/0_079_NODE_337_length_3116_cov_17_791355_g317_i069893
MKEIRSIPKQQLSDSLVTEWLQMMSKISESRRTLKVCNPFAQLSEHVFCCAVSAIVESETAVLQQHKVTTVINCSNTSLELESVTVVSIPDARATSSFLGTNFEFVCEALEAVRGNKQRAVLACTSGVNRAAVLCAAYLMWWRKSSLVSTLQTMADRMGPLFGVHSYQHELLDFANQLGRLDPPSTWPSLEDERHPASAELTSGWTRPSRELFDDDADYDNPSDDETGRARSPQQIAEAHYREALRRFRELQGMKTRIHIGSDCASDGGDTDLL